MRILELEKGQLVHTKNPLAYFVNAKLGLGSGMKCIMKKISLVTIYHFGGNNPI